MKYSASLKTSGYELKFYIRKLDQSPEHLGIIVMFLPCSEYSVPPIKSITNTMLVDGIEQLARYLENHISSLSHNPAFKSGVFLTYGDVFQMQALGGEVHSDSEGVFSIQCMVNVGNPTNQPFSTYLGGEAVITIKDANKFVEDLRVIIAELRS